ncbi:hypothetical protein LUZ60_004869 [Juncus effusus]|nr:hypothetical protein LUZ60_004869 [Juncus effusus]
MGKFEKIDSTMDLNVSFGYHNSSSDCLHSSSPESPNPISNPNPNPNPNSNSKLPTSNSFSRLSGAAISANFTLANTNILNGLISSEILPELDSPNSFRKLTSSPSLNRLDVPSSCPSPSRNSPTEKSSYSPTESPNFLNLTDVRTAGGPAGEDRVQAVCSEKDGFLFCGIYDGFNGRDCADFLAVTLYENIAYYLHQSECQIKKQQQKLNSNLMRFNSELTMEINMSEEPSDDRQIWSRTFRKEVVNSLVKAVDQAESDFLTMVESEMEDRPDLVSVGSCLLTTLLHGTDLYVLNLGDSRAVLATVCSDGFLKAVQLTESHTVDDELEREKLLSEHEDDEKVVSFGKIKGKLKVTRAIGVGYLKKKSFNDALMGILRVKNLKSPPYVKSNPHTLIHDVSPHDSFIVLGSDGLFDFFNNEQVVGLVYNYISEFPAGDPAKYLIDQLVLKAAQKAGFTTEQLMNVPAGRRRKYHDDVTVIVILLGNKHQTLTASIKI